MSVHEISSIIQKYSDETIKVTDIRIGLVCTVCGHTWGIRVDDEQELMQQINRFICMPCYQKKISGRNERNVSYGKEEPEWGT